MKLSFSTLGCPDWSYNEIFSVVSDLGYDGIEIRGIADEIYAPRISVFAPDVIENTKSKLKQAGIAIPILTTAAYLVENPDLAASEFEVKDYVLLAQKLGVPYVRVLAEKTPDPVSSDHNLEAIAERYGVLCDFAKPFGVTVLTENNGFLADSSQMAKLMEMVARENMGVIWDIHHPYRYYGEDPETTVSRIGRYIKHVHVKDSVVGRNGKLTYMLTGYGDIPVAEAVKSLNDIGYDGFYSYEWVKRWSRELAEPGVAFYQYINYMRDLSC